MRDSIQIIQDGQSDLAASAYKVRDRLQQIQSNLESNLWEMCCLLDEAQANNYNVIYGFARFDDWVEDPSSGLNMSRRNAFYHLQISRKSKILGITPEQVMSAKISKLKKIYTLDITQFAPQIKDLIDRCPRLTLGQVEEEVHNILKAAGEQPPEYMTLKFSPGGKATVEQACDLIAMEHGGYDVDGEHTPPSKGQCVELMAADYLADPNHTPEGYIPTEEHDE